MNALLPLWLMILSVAAIQYTAIHANSAGAHPYAHVEAGQ